MNKKLTKDEIRRRLFVKQLEEIINSGQPYILFSQQILWILFFVCIMIFFAVKNKIAKNYLQEQVNFSDDKVLKITFFDVRQGDSAIVTFPSGKSLLIDAGAAKGMIVEESEPGDLIMEFDAGKKVLIPYIQKNHIILDGIIITHHHSDHFGGILSLLQEGIIPKWIMDNGVQAYHPEFFKLLVLMKEKNVEYKQFKLGKLNIDPDVEVEVLAPMTNYSFTEVDRAINNASLVLKITYKSFSVLFTGDIETFAEMDLLEYKSKLKSTVLKVPHHGSSTSTSLPFLDMVSPEVAIISCGKGNPFGHPHEETIVKLNNAKVKIYRTDYNGTISIITDGNNYKVNVEKEY